MTTRRSHLALVSAALIAALPGLARAATVEVPAGGLATALAAAAPGDVLRLLPGEHAGPVTIDRPLTLEGAKGAVVRGDGKGVVVTVTAPDVILRGLEITGSGLDLERMDAGVRLEKSAVRARVEGNRIVDNLIGVHVNGAPDSAVRDNLIEGRRDRRVNERGNGVWLWNAPGAVVERNEIAFGRDGIFVTTSRKNAFRDNLMHDVRFAVHYMYTNDSEVSGNRSIRNDLGYALMFSSRLKVLSNLSDGDREHGILLNYANDSLVQGNVVRDGGEKCVFIYDANKNRILENRFEGCGIGVHFTAGSERNVISGNAFIGNRTQVKYVGTRWLDWSYQGRGNYWSDNPAFDLDGDGIADTPYRPNDLVDQILWTQPLAKLLLNSPAVQLLRWAQSQFPALYPGGVVDTKPLMRPVDTALAVATAERAR
ncbi:nitrous oxide reductase family maturation protein NosD [Benzoatithermus flavus]|uniref:Nitrous oxide reductase family maturation protein NosD n=1 Tax=Benzoatithermus flavus TaxID=3108223 RepID=A0ABU8XRY5_9PROT